MIVNLKLSEIVESNIAMRFVDTRRLEYIQLRDTMHSEKSCPPIVVRERADGKFEIIDGSHRYAVAKELHWEELPAEIKNVSDDEALLLSLRRNAGQILPKPLEYAVQIRKILARNPDWTIGMLAGHLYQPTDWVKQQLDLLRLHEKIQRDVEAGRINLSSAYILSQAPKNWQLEYRERALILTTEELRAELIPPLKSWRQKILATKQSDREFNFEPIAHVRNIKILKAALDNPSVADTLVVENHCATLADAFRLGVAWALNLDPASAQHQRLVAQRKYQKIQALDERRRKERTRRAARPPIQ